MFLKLFGAAFVIAGCSALGIGYGRKLNLHLEELRFLRELYRMIRGEIQYTKEPFPEVMLEVSSRIKEPYASLFVQAHRAFEEQGSLQFPKWFRSYTSGTLESYRRERGMTDEEWEQFLSLGGQTGYLDLDMQIGTLKLSGERWETWIRGGRIPDRTEAEDRKLSGSAWRGVFDDPAAVRKKKGRKCV